MSIKTGRKLGFWAAISMLIGSVVGIGIFFKNGSISKMTNGNGATWLMAWIIGGVLALSLAISFSEIGTFKKESKTEGLAKWCSAVGGKKYGYFAQFQFSFFYTGLFVFVLGFFASEATLQGIVVAGLMDQYTVPIWGHALIGIGITTILVILNIISTKVSGIFQQITVVLKFIPLIMAALIGIIMSTTHNAIGTNANYPLLGTNAFGHGSFDAKAIVVALPAVLFAYDGFLNVATMQKKVKNGEKQIPKILFIGMIMVIIINSMISLASILHSAPSVDELFSDTFKKTASKVITIIVYVFICISAWGVVNGYAAGFWTSMEQATQTNLFFGMKTIKKKKSEFFVTLLYSFLIIAFWACILLIPSIILKTDSLIDSFSNWPTFFIFAILAITILFYTIKRKKMQTIKMNKFIYWPFAIIAIVGIFGTLLFSIGYSTIYVGFISNPNGESSYGLFQPAIPGVSKRVSNLIGSIMFFVQFGIFLLMPLINHLLRSKIEKVKIEKEN